MISSYNYVTSFFNSYVFDYLHMLQTELVISNQDVTSSETSISSHLRNSTVPLNSGQYVI